MTREVANDERTAKDIRDELKSHATSTKKEKEDESVERHSVLGFKCVCVLAHACVACVLSFHAAVLLLLLRCTRRRPRRAGGGRGAA